MENMNASDISLSHMKIVISIISGNVKMLRNHTLQYIAEHFCDSEEAFYISKSEPSIRGVYVSF